jgi:hypothetical protein
MKTRLILFALLITQVSSIQLVSSQTSKAPEKKAQVETLALNLGGPAPIKFEPIRGAQLQGAERCPVLHNEKPKACSCTDAQGHHYTEQAQCISCWTAGTNSRSCGIQCYQCCPPKDATHRLPSCSSN